MTLFSTAAMAQHDAEIEAVHAHFKDNSKKNIIRKFMKLEGETADKFWVIYDEYEAARKKYVDQQEATIVAYIENFDNMTDEIAEKLLDDARSRRAAEVQLKTKYLRRMERELGGMIALKFAEIDHYIDLVSEKPFSESLPFIGEDW